MKSSKKYVILTVVLVVVAVAVSVSICILQQKKTEYPTFLTKTEQANIIESISKNGYDDFEDFYLSVYRAAGYDIPEQPISIWDAPISWEEKEKYISSVREKTGDTHSDEFIMRTSFIGADIFTD